MKKLRGVLVMVVCVALLISVTVSANAASSILLRATKDGYNCVGQGNILDGNVANGGFQATITDEISATIDPELCSSRVSVVVYDADGFPLETVHGTYGNLQSGVRYESNEPIGNADFYYRFNGTTWGPFSLESDG